MNLVAINKNLLTGHNGKVIFAFVRLSVFSKQS